MTEYKGFRYMQYANGQFILRLPSGFRSIIQIESEEALRAKIDELAASAENNP